MNIWLPCKLNFHRNVQEDKEWDLSEEMVADLKEIFILFDKDTDGVLTIEQVYQAMNVMGMRRPGKICFEVNLYYIIWKEYRKLFLTMKECSI